MLGLLGYTGATWSVDTLVDEVATKGICSSLVTEPTFGLWWIRVGCADALGQQTSGAQGAACARAARRTLGGWPGSAGQHRALASPAWQVYHACFRIASRSPRSRAVRVPQNAPQREAAAGLHYKAALPRGSVLLLLLQERLNKAGYRAFKVDQPDEDTLLELFDLL